MGSLVSPSVVPGVRPTVRGKFVFVGDRKFYIRGVTYGPFRLDEHGSEYHTPDVVEWDFAQMAAKGINAVRTYTVPPQWLLDIAQNYGLRVMVGLPWEQHITFLDHKKRAKSIEERVQAGVRACTGHPAILCYTVGNEIPASVVRWYGRRRVERFLKRLYQAAKAEDPEGLVTYVNYPTTEYLQLPFLDFACFNVYLESQDCLDAYLARLQNLVGNRPLVMAEIGLDSRQNGEHIQAVTLDWQVRTVFAAGCAGAFVFAWTDEWHRGGYDIEDWDFGLTDRDRRPKPALASVRKAFAEVPFPPDLSWPRISVVVCSYNGSRTIDECCKGLLNLEYPNYEVIIVDDGSSDATAAIVGGYGFRVISSTENQGLSNARNTGLEAATGEIVAYLDDDACPDPHWLTYLAADFLSTEHVGVGGPTIPPPGDGPIADCVANSPGNPTHVLLSDQEAEHIPGCNIAFRKAALEAIGGFDTQFRIAGDDVDVCWRLQQRGWSLGFSPNALVWHHCRDSVKAYWKQQLNYGKAEAMLEMKWPEKFNTFGQLTWQGRLYGNGLKRALRFRRWRVYHGVWGSGLFQSIYEIAPGTLSSLPLMPEWYLVVGGLGLLSVLGLLWAPLLLALPLLVLAIGAVLGQAVVTTSHASFPTEPRSRVEWVKAYSLTVFLHLLQPLARLSGRLCYGLTPWRRRTKPCLVFPRPRSHSIWSEHWQASETRLESIEATLRELGAVVERGGDCDRWDLEVWGGLFGSVRALMAIEEHGAGKQLVRLRTWPRFRPFGMVLSLVAVALLMLAALAVFDHIWIPSVIMGFVAVLFAPCAFGDWAIAADAYLHALKQVGREEG